MCWSLIIDVVLSGDGGLVVRLGFEGSQVVIPPRPSDFSEQKIRPTFHPGCINGYPDRAVFVQVCYSLSAITRCTLLAKGREIKVSFGRIDCRFHKVAK